jgi:hypothetical protein
MDRDAAVAVAARAEDMQQGPVEEPRIHLDESCPRPIDDLKRDLGHEGLRHPMNHRRPTQANESGSFCHR